MSNNKQSSVEFAIEKLEKFIPSGNQLAIFAILEQAKAMHKEEIKNAYNAGYREGEHDGVALSGNDNDISDYDNAEQYYNQTFNNNE